MYNEQKSWAPLWLEYSGLPQVLAGETKSPVAWLFLRKIIEIDCASNPEPAVVEVSLAELSNRTGLAVPAIIKAAKSLRKLKLLKCFIPEDEEEAGLFELQVPLPCPIGRGELRAKWPQFFGHANARLRYLDPPESPGTVYDDAAPDPGLQEIVDLYFNTVGMKMNSFILDELRLVRHRFPLDDVRKVFRRAGQNEIRSLSWIVRELIRQKKRKHDEEAPLP